MPNITDMYVCNSFEREINVGYMLEHQRITIVTKILFFVRDMYPNTWPIYHITTDTL